MEHMQSENAQEWDRTMATISHHARYELPDGCVVDGHDAVMEYWSKVAPSCPTSATNS
jgi:hypothetical protein